MGHCKVIGLMLSAALVAGPGAAGARRRRRARPADGRLRGAAARPGDDREVDCFLMALRDERSSLCRLGPQPSRRHTSLATRSAPR